MNNGNLTSLCVMGFVYIVLVCVLKVLQLTRLDLPFCMVKYATVRESRWSGIVSLLGHEMVFANLLFGHFYVFYY